MSARKKSVSQPQQPRPELLVRPRRGRVLIILALCLLVFAIITEAVSSIFLSPDSNGIGVILLFALLYLVSLVYLLGVGWSAVRLLTNDQPSLQADEQGVTLRHLPFLGTISLPWSEIKSVHTTRSLMLTHLCFVPASTSALLSQRNLLLFALNASARMTMRTNTALSISQNALDRPAQELIAQFVTYYGVKETPQKA